MKFARAIPTQTDFNFEEPFLQPDSELVGDDDVKPKKRTPWIIIGGIGLVALLLLLLVVVTVMNRTTPVVEDEIKIVEISPTPGVIDPITARIMSLQQQLEIADPNVQVFVFPAVTTNLRIDDKR